MALLIANSTCINGLRLGSHGHVYLLGETLDIADSSKLTTWELAVIFAGFLLAIHIICPSIPC